LFIGFIDKIKMIKIKFRNIKMTEAPKNLSEEEVIDDSNTLSHEELNDINNIVEFYLYDQFGRNNIGVKLLSNNELYISFYRNSFLIRKTTSGYIISLELGYKEVESVSVTTFADLLDVFEELLTQYDY